MAVVSWLSNDNEVTKKKIRDDNVAHIELNASSASKTYTVGKRFVLDSDGKLYKATQQINQGSAIITSGANANCEEVTEKVLDTLGTASTKNSTSVVTQSTDLVESGAVYDALGFGNKNLLDPSVLSNDSMTYVPIYVGSGEFTLSSTMSQTAGQHVANIFLLAGSVSTGASTSTNGVWNRNPRTVTSVDGYVTIASRNFDNENPRNYNTQLEKGTVATAYEPYHTSVNDTLKNAEVVEGKNALNNTAVSGYSNGVTFEVDSDKIVTLKTGSPSSTVFINVGQIPSKGSWILNGVTNGSSSTYGLTVRTSDLQNPSFGAVDNYNGDTLFTIPEDYNNPLFVYIRIPTTSTVNNNVIKPMLRRPTESDPTYEPYYVPLKDVVPNKADNSVIGTAENDTNPTKSYAVGEHMIRGGKFCTVTSPVTTSSTWTLGGNYVEGTIADNLVKQEAFTITTNVGGLANLTNQNSRIILRIDSANSKICFPYRTTGGTNNIIVFNNDMTVAANLEVTGTYYYI